MSDALPEDSWVNDFLTTPPRPLLTALQRRLHASTTHINALADLYKQRAAIEAQYADSLSKLARTAESGGLIGKGGVDWDKAGGERRIWDGLITEMSETSSSHSTLAAVLKTDFEQPIRDLPNKIVAWRRIGDMDSSLEKTLNQYEKTSSKLEKSSGKSKAGKADALSSELNQLTASLSSLSPMVYTTYQRLDEERLRGLKEVIVRWGTVRGDLATRDGERSDRAVAALIGWETSDEVVAVGRRLGGAGGSHARTGSAPVLNNTPETPRSVRRLSSITSVNSGTGTQDYSPRPASRQNGSINNVNPSPSTFSGGLKSMLGRTKSTMGGAGRGRSNSNATSMRSARPDAAFETIGEDDLRQQAPQVASPPPVDDEGFSVAPADRHRNPWEDPNELVPTPAKGMSASPPGPNATAFAQTFNSSPEVSQDNLSSSSSSQNNPPRLNLAMTQQPIQESEEERQIALQKMQQTLAMPPQQSSRRGTTARGRRDVRNTMFGGGSDDGLSKGALAEMGNGSAFPMPPTNGNGHGVERPQQVARQSSMSSVTSNNPFDSPVLAAGLSPSTMATASEPGLRASITETINVIMRNAEILRLQINGEVYLSLRLPSASQSAGPIHIRLTQFEQLEKIAPNPAFLAQVPDRPGEYFLNSEILATATQRGSTKGTLLFKYQVHVPAGKERPAAPLILEPAFMCKEGETRMILSYRVNPDSPLSSASITNLSFLAAFTPGVNVSNVQAKPAGGIWSPATRRMTWNVDEMSGTDGKIIAKFTTEPGEAMTPQAVQASWAVEGVLGSGIGLEVVDGALEGGWTFEEVRKGVTTGKYLAEPIIN